MLCPDERLQIAAPRAGHAPPSAQAVRRAGAAGRDRRARRAGSRWSPWWSALVALGLAAWRFVVPAGSSCQDTRLGHDAQGRRPPGRLDDQRQPVRRRPQADDVRRSDARRRDVGAGGRVRDHHVLPLRRRRRRDALRRRREGRGPDGRPRATTWATRRSARRTRPNATFLQLRHGDVVVYLAASGDADAVGGRRARLRVRQGARRRRRPGRGRHRRTPARRLGRAVGRRRVPSGAAEETVSPGRARRSRRRSRPRSATSR